ncbi:MAG: hypothetical protein DMD96_03005 [Candidatus Rokuibacteriota bacterium]|nr:MAG: hypothetical protein DMD96_03005 [Candidatus Rokubacteria bacterium]
MGEWVVIAVDQDVCWASSETSVDFRGRELILRPPDGERYGDISLERVAGESYEEGATLIRRFLSVQSWLHEQPFPEAGESGGTHRIRLGGRLPTGRKIFPGLRFDDLPTRPSPTQELALALYRHALGLGRHSMYQFFAFFRILNITLRDSSTQKAWINAGLSALTFGRDRASEILKTEPDVGEYLYKSGRSALAHAYDEPLVDPDRFVDTRRINQDLHLLRQLVELYMERDLGLPRR